MISCDDVRGGLVAAMRREASEEFVAAVDAHLSGCASCAAEYDGLRRAAELVHDHVHPEVSADARIRLRAAIEAELTRFAPPSRRSLGRTFLVPVALAAGIVASFLVPAGTIDPVPHAEHDSVRISRAANTAGELGPRSIEAVSRGLEWLASRQRADGVWSPSGNADAETKAAATASALLAFGADGQSPHRGPHAAALRRARDRLMGLVAAGFSNDADRKPIYAQALSIRALSSVYVLDRNAMTVSEQRDLRDVLSAAGRQLVDGQTADGGFGYVPNAPRPDASCTLFAAAALTDLRATGLADAAGAISRAGRYLESLRDADGDVAYMRPGDRRSAPALTAAFLALDGEFGPARPAEAGALAAIEQALAEGGDALLAWTGTAALARHGKPLAAPVRSLLASQRGDGAWAAAKDLRCAAAGDTVTTAFGVLALAQCYGSR